MVRRTLLTALFAVWAIGVVACQSSDEQTPEPQVTATPRASVTVLEPGPSVVVDPGQNVSIQVEAEDESGIGRIELWLDGALVDSDEPPIGHEDPTYQSFLFWTAEGTGRHTIEVKVFGDEGTLHSTATQQISVSDSPVVVSSPPTSRESSRTSAVSAQSTSTAVRRTTSSLAGPTIRYFKANVTEASPGDQITLEWDAPGATRGFLYVERPDGSFEAPQEVYPKGTLVVRIDADAEDEARFTLSMLNNSGDQVEQKLALPLTGAADSPTGQSARLPGSANQWFFNFGPDSPPSSSPIWSWGAQQHYANGLMIWVEDLREIYVLYGSGEERRWESYPDLYTDDMPELDESLSPPSGYQQPIRGFGLLWRSTPSVRDGLGWPWDDEVGAWTAVQLLETDVGGVTFLKNLYSGVYRLEPDGTWTFLPDPGPLEPTPEGQSEATAD